MLTIQQLIICIGGGMVAGILLCAIHVHRNYLLTTKPRGTFADRRRADPKTAETPTTPKSPNTVN